MGKAQGKGKSSNCWRVGPETVLIVVNFFFQTPKNILLKSFSWQLILYYSVISFIIFLTFHFISLARTSSSFRARDFVLDIVLIYSMHFINIGAYEYSQHHISPYSGCLHGVIASLSPFLLSFHPCTSFLL